MSERGLRLEDARAKGVLKTWVLKHGLRNAASRSCHDGTAIWLCGGSIVVEKCFNWPGLGRLLVDSVDMRITRDSGGVLLFSLEFILIN